MTTSTRSAFETNVGSLVTTGRLDQAFEAAREAGGACTIDRLPVFLKAFMAAFKRGTGRQVAKLPYGRMEINARAEALATDWFKLNCTPF